MAGQAPIHIKESRKGTFTAAATAHHMSPEEFAADVHEHPDEFSGKMAKKAAFVRNIAEK